MEFCLGNKNIKSSRRVYKFRYLEKKKRRTDRRAGTTNAFFFFLLLPEDRYWEGVCLTGTNNTMARIQRPTRIKKPFSFSHLRLGFTLQIQLIPEQTS